MSTRRAQDPQGAWQCDHGAPSFAAQDPEFVQEVRQWEQHGVVAAWRPRAVRLQGTDVVPAEAGPDRWVGVPRMTSPAAFLVQRRTAGAWRTAAPAGHGAALQHGPARWTVHCAEQGQMGPEYCALVLAVPAPQAAALLEPVSPYAAALAASARMQPCWVAMLRTDAPAAGLGCGRNHGWTAVLGGTRQRQARTARATRAADLGTACQCTVEPGSHRIGR